MANVSQKTAASTTAPRHKWVVGVGECSPSSTSSLYGTVIIPITAIIIIYFFFGTLRPGAPRRSLDAPPVTSPTPSRRPGAPSPLGLPVMAPFATFLSLNGAAAMILTALLMPFLSMTQQGRDSSGWRLGAVRAAICAAWAPYSNVTLLITQANYYGK